MKQILLILAVLLLIYTPTSAQVQPDPTADFVRLKTMFVDASNNKKNSKQLKSVANQLDEFLSHVKIVHSSDAKHNMTPYLLCMYDSIPLSTDVIIRNGEFVDTILFQDGKWYIPREISHEMIIETLCLVQDVNKKNRTAMKIAGALQKKYSKLMGDELAGDKVSLFYVKEEDLYYAAIESKKIPQFAILSNSQVLNYASCFKAILQASGIEATYDEILKKYLNASIDVQSIEVNDCDKMMAGRKIVTSVISGEDISASDIADELLHERFMIAIMEDGAVGILTAIAMSGDKEYEPVHVRLRIPMFAKENQRVQKPWAVFGNQVVALVKIEIF